MCRRLLVDASATRNRSEDTLPLQSLPQGTDDFWPAVQQITRDIAGHFSSLALEFEDYPSYLSRVEYSLAPLTQTQHEDESVANNHSGMYS